MGPVGSHSKATWISGFDVECTCMAANSENIEEVVNVAGMGSAMKVFTAGAFEPNVDPQHI